MLAGVIAPLFAPAQRLNGDLQICFEIDRVREYAGDTWRAGAAIDRRHPV